MKRLVFLLVVAASCSSLYGGQYSDAKRRIAEKIEESKNLKLPTAGRPVPAELGPDWKRKVYDGIAKNLKERERRTHHYLFLEPPTRCTVSQGRMFRKNKVSTGLGGLLAVRRDGRIFDSNELLFYLLDDAGNVQMTVWHEEFNSYTIEPKLFEFVMLSEAKSGFIPLVPPATLLRMAAFRKADIKKLPAFE